MIYDEYRECNSSGESIFRVLGRVSAPFQLHTTMSPAACIVPTASRVARDSSSEEPSCSDYSPRHHQYHQQHHHHHHHHQHHHHRFPEKIQPLLSPLVADDDILLHLVPFLAKNEGYLFVGSVAKSWREAWGTHPKRTHMDNVVESASRLEWASRTPNWVWDESICKRSAAGGHLGALKYARSQGCPWDEQTCTEAAAAGNLSILRWAKQNGCPWNETTCAYAAKRGDLDMLRWARTVSYTHLTLPTILLV